MGFINQNFSDNISITISIDGLANGTFVDSSAINNNTGNNFVSASIQVQLTTGAGTLSNGSIICYLARSVDGGSTFDDINDNLQPLAVFNANTDNTTFTFSMDTAILGTLPSAWKLVIFNNTGANLGTGSYAKYTGKQYFAF